MSWEKDIQLELQRARDAQRLGNHGRARTAARRVVGLAVEELQKRSPDVSYGRDSIVQLRSLATDPRVPEDARNTAQRLQARITPDFQSQSVDPVGDAEIILAYIFTLLH